ncbi:target of Nesh-SH3-like isoform X2 [Mugil cephalus]|nr:target of Nesh-SH3-like isoform X2 [Mugil cephalus]
MDTSVLLLLRVSVLLLGGTSVLRGVPAQRVRASLQNMKVRIRATGDTVVLEFVRPRPDVKLEGFVLGYGSSVFSRQFIQIPEDGRTYHTELDAEPKYLVAVQPIPANDVTKHCTGEAPLDKPLHLVIGSVSPTAVLLSWGNQLKAPYEGDVMDQCLEEGFYTIRYREKNRKWIYQTCPTSDTVIDNLKPNTPYEFSVRSNKHDRSGAWSKPVVHQTTRGNNAQKTFKLRSPVPKPMNPLVFFPPRPVLLNGTRPRLSSAINSPGFPGVPRTSFGPPARTSLRFIKNPNSVGKPGGTVKVNNLKHVDESSILNLKVSTAKTTKQERKRTLTTTSPTTVSPTTTSPTMTSPPTVSPATSAPRQETWEESDLFQSEPTSDLDAMGKKRYTAPHVVYQTGKKPDEPCSITSSLGYFPQGERGETNVTSPPRSPPTNVTVVTVEGCPSFIILDWERTDNDTTEYEVISTAKGPDGEQVSILTTNQTHTAVENLKPESSYEFKVKPKNELGAGPPSEPVSFSTESADPRVSENISGKDAIWTQFPFRTDSYSDCHGKQYVKRTWYRKFVGVQLCNSLRYKIYLSDSLNGKFYNVGDQTGFGEDHCQFVDSFLDGRTGQQLRADQLPSRPGFYRAVRQEPVHFGQMGRHSHVNYVS